MDILYYKRQLIANKIKRKIATIRKNLQFLKVILSLIMAFGICVFGIWVLKLPQWYIDSSRYSKMDPSVVSIQGNYITPDYKIINMVRQTKLPYTQIYRLKTKELEENIAQLQTIKKVYIKRYWFPARIVIVVEERTPAFFLLPNLESEPNSALTIDGVLIDHDYFPFKNSIKAKKILTYGVRNGEDDVWDKKRVDEILKLTKAIEAYSNQEVQYIDIRNEKDVYVMIKDYLIRFGEINGTILSRAKWIASILPEANKIKNKIKYIDLRWEDSRYFCLKGSKELNQDNVVKVAQSKENKKDKLEENKTNQENTENIQGNEELNQEVQN